MQPLHRLLLTLAIVAVTQDGFCQSATPATPPDPSAQTAPAPAPAPAPTPDKSPSADDTTQTAPAVVDPGPGVLSEAASSSYDRRDGLPTVNIYLPEGQASIRLRKLIRNVLFESQIEYKFVNGDISTYLRYKYYARNYTYRIGVFDSIEFPDVGSSSKTEFERVRGGLFLVGIPRNNNNRYFWLVQDDRLTFGDLTRRDNRKNNIYTKVGYQYGTQFDERLNAIVGETRGRITPVLTAFRDIGPQKTSLAAAITHSDTVATGDYKYTKLEAEALRRFDVTQTSFVFSRLHVGSFLQRNETGGEDLPATDRYSIPRYELFKLGGREALKSISDSETSQGTQEVHLTNELFVPVFRNRDYRTWLLHWNTLYGIGYLGAGSVAFEASQLGKSNHLVVDAGIGTEAALTVRDFDVYLSVIYAHSVESPDGMGGSKVRFSIRTVR